MGVNECSPIPIESLSLQNRLSYANINIKHLQLPIAHFQVSNPIGHPFISWEILSTLKLAASVCYSRNQNISGFYQCIQTETKWPLFCIRHFLLHLSQWTLSRLIQITLKFALEGSTNNKPAQVDIMAWRRIGHYLNQWLPDLQMYI